jgi:hypothetical protein
MIVFQPDAPVTFAAPLFDAHQMIAVLQGRVNTRKELRGKSQSDDEKWKHDRVIQECEMQIAQLQRAAS